MLTTLKLLRTQLRDRYGRFSFMNSIWRHIPGIAGEYIRYRKITPYLESAGDDITFQEGIKIWGVHRLSIGNRVNIASDCFLQATGGIRLEDEVMLGPRVSIWTTNHKIAELDVPIQDQGSESAPVFIGRGCWLGGSVFVMPGVTLPEGCVVSAGSVLGKKKYPPFSIIAGYPARVIGSRLPQSSG